MDYPFANGVVKAIESQLLDRVKYAKLAKAASRREFLAQLAGFGRGDGTADLGDVLAAEMLSLRRRFQEITPDPFLTDLFFLSADALNLKILSKEIRYGASVPGGLSPLGAIEADRLAHAVRTGDGTDLPSRIRPFVEAALGAAEAASSPRALAAGIDSALAAFRLRSLPRRGAEALRIHFSAVSDFANLTSLLRSRLLGWDEDGFREMLLPGGLISEETLLAAWSRDDSLVPSAFRDFYAEKPSRILKRGLETKNGEDLERAFAQLLLDLAKEESHDPFGIGPIVYYWLKKDAEGKNLRRLAAEGPNGLSALLD